MNWIRDIEIADLLDKDTRLIFEHCGLDTLCSLWENLPSIQLYLSQQPLNAARKRYIRKHHDGTNVKSLAVELGVSERFVYEAVATTEQKDDRQAKLL